MSSPQTTPSFEPPETQDNLVTWIKSLVPKTDRRDDTESAIGRLMSDLAVSDLRRLDSDMRWANTWRSQSWESMSVAEAETTIRQSSDQVVVAAGLSMHRSGYIREMAVRSLASTQDERALRWLVIRTSDSVDQVRQVALDGSAQFLLPEHADRLVEVLSLFGGRRALSGIAASELGERVEQVLMAPESLPALRRGVSAVDTSTRRASVRLLVRRGEGVELLAKVLERNDVAPITIVASSIPTEGPSNLEAGRLLHDSRVGHFRSQGLWRLVHNNTGADAGLLARRGLMDRARSVRDVAQRWLAAHEPEVDVNDYYRDRLAGDPAAVLRGLGDHACEDDADVAARHMSHDIAAVRLAALRLLASLGRHVDTGLFVDRFLAGTSKERREAVRGLKRLHGADFVEPAWLAAAELEGHVGRERVLMQLLPMADRWVQIGIGLEATASPDRELSDAGIKSLYRSLAQWNRGYPSTSGLDVGRLRGQIERARPALQIHDRGNFRRSLESAVVSLLPAE